MATSNHRSWRLETAMKCATILLAAVVVLVAAPAWADEAGLQAFIRGDYATALKEYRPLAEQGDAVAQFALGTMYENGRGVPQDDKEAVRWYRLAAEQGEASAQNNLAKMSRRGRGVPKDDVLAHMWWNFAAAQGHENARRARDRLAARMHPAQLAVAQRLAREWKPKSK